MNDWVSSASEYHSATTHIRNRIKPHFLDFDQYPQPLKWYDAQSRISLEKTLSHESKDLMGLFRRKGETGAVMDMDLQSLKRVLYLAYGVTRTQKAQGLVFFSRTVPSAGGLYPCHLYLVVRRLKGLETGVYYCNMIQGSLDLIHTGCFEEHTNNRCGLSFILTGGFFNSAWKYRERAFRYLLLDCGHLTENLFLSLRAEGQSPEIMYDFKDDDISASLCLDNEKEVPLACMHLLSEGSAADLESEFKITSSSIFSKEIKPAGSSYPLLKHIHDLGKTIFEPRGNQVLAREVFASGSHTQKGFSVSIETRPFMDYENAVMLRRSRRNFIPAVLEKTAFETLMASAASLYDGNENSSSRIMPFLTMGVMLRNVEGMEDGVYQLSHDSAMLVRIKKGVFQEALSRVCLDQSWLANAAINFLFMANLAGLERFFGPRGYRALLMDAGRIAQRIYLAATGLFLGCCGIGALYDEEAKDLLDLNQDSALFYVVASGKVKG